MDNSFTKYTQPYNGDMSSATTKAAQEWVTKYLKGETVPDGLSLYGLGTAIHALWSHNSGIPNPYITNIGKATGHDPDFQRVVEYINLPDVRDALHVPPGEPAVSGWGGSNTAWNTWNQSMSVVPHIQTLLDSFTNTKVLVLSGLNDAKDCNWIGTERWLMHSLQDSQAVQQFRASTPVPWHTGAHGDGPVGGTEQGTGQLRWLKVENAGHMAVMDQPDLIFYIMSRMF